MKSTRLISFVIALVIAFSTQAPFPVMAQQESHSSIVEALSKIEPKGKTPGKTQITLTNQTGIVLYLNFESQDGKNPNYSFVIGNNGKGRFLIKPGKYLVAISSACWSTKTWKGNYKDQNYHFGTYICGKKHKKNSWW